MPRLLWTGLAAGLVAVLLDSDLAAQTPTTPPRDFSRVQSYSGTLKVSGSGSRTDTQGRATTTEQAALNVAIACLPGPPNCLVVGGGGAFLQGTVNGPLSIEREQVLNMPFGPPVTTILRGNGTKTGPVSLAVSPFPSALTTAENTYGFQYDHMFQCQASRNGQVTGSDLCFYGPNIPVGTAPLVGPSMVGTVPLPAFGLTLSGSASNTHPDDPFNGSYNVQWNLQCDPRTLTVPVLRQFSLPWRADLLNNQPGKTIWGKGCTLTSLAMALTFAGYPHNPGTLNRFMIQNGGFSANNGVIFQKSVSRATGGQMKFVPFDSSSTRDIEDVLCMGYPVIVGVGLDAGGQPGHYVVVTGKEGSQLLIHDPAYTDVTRLSQWSTFVTRGFLAPRDFSSRRPIAFDAATNEGSIALHSSDSVELMVVDATGRRTGFDPATGSIFEEIPGSVYFRDSLLDIQTALPDGQPTRYLQIDRAVQGAYQVVVTGKRLGNYSIGVDTFAQNGSEQTSATIQGAAQIGASAVSLQYSSTAGGTSQVGAPGCAWVARSLSIQPSTGGTASLDVTAPPGCAWTASSDSTWAQIVSGGSGNGNGLVNLQVLANATNTVRSGIVRVAGVALAITQRRTSQTFNDVANSHPFFDAINLLLTRQVTRGCSTSPLMYCPEAIVTRGQMAAFIVRSLLGDNFTFSATPSFTDVPASHPFFSYIQKMRELGVTDGCSPAQYCPDAAVTRGQMAVFVIRAKLGATTAFAYPASAYFRDANGLHLFYRFIQKMRELGITRGCSATDYCPESPVTRGQMAVFLMRGLFAEPGI